MSHPLYNPYASENQSSTQGQDGPSSTEVERDPQREISCLESGSSFSAPGASETPANSWGTLSSLLSQSMNIERSQDMNICMAKEEVRLLGNHQSMDQDTYFIRTRRNEFLSTSMGMVSYQMSSTSVSLGHEQLEYERGRDSWSSNYKRPTEDDPSKFYSSSASSNFADSGNVRTDAFSETETSIPGLRDSDNPVPDKTEAPTEPSTPEHAPKSLSKVLNYFGLKEEDLDYLMPLQDQITIDSLPKILQQMQIEKSKRATTAVQSESCPEPQPTKSVSEMKRHSFSSSGGAGIRQEEMSSAVLQPSKVIDYGQSDEQTGGAGDETGQTSGIRANSNGSISVLLMDTCDSRGSQEQLKEDTTEVKSSALGSSCDQSSSVSNLSSALSSVAPPSNDQTKQWQTQPNQTSQTFPSSFSLPNKDTDTGVCKSEPPKPVPLKEPEAHHQLTLKSQPPCTLYHVGHPSQPDIVLFNSNNTGGTKDENKTQEQSAVAEQMKKQQPVQPMQQKSMQQIKLQQKQPVWQTVQAPPVMYAVKSEVDCQSTSKAKPPNTLLSDVHPSQPGTVVLGSNDTIGAKDQSKTQAQGLTVAEQMKKQQTQQQPVQPKQQQSVQQKQPVWQTVQAPPVMYAAKSVPPAPHIPGTTDAIPSTLSLPDKDKYITVFKSEAPKPIPLKEQAAEHQLTTKTQPPSTPYCIGHPSRPGIVLLDIDYTKGTKTQSKTQGQGSAVVEQMKNQQTQQQSEQEKEQHQKKMWPPLVSAVKSESLASHEPSVTDAMQHPEFVPGVLPTVPPSNRLPLAEVAVSKGLPTAMMHDYTTTTPKVIFVTMNDWASHQDSILHHENCRLLFKSLWKPEAGPSHCDASYNAAGKDAKPSTSASPQTSQQPQQKHGSCSCSLSPSPRHHHGSEGKREKRRSRSLSPRHVIRRSFSPSPRKYCSTCSRSRSNSRSPERHSPPMRRDERRSSPRRRDNRRSSPRRRDNRRSSPRRRDNRQSPSRRRVQRRSPRRKSGKSQSPSSSSNERQWPSRSSDERQSPPRKRERSSPRRRVQRISPQRRSDEKQLSSRNTDKRRSPSRSSDERQSPPRRKDQRRSPRRSDEKQLPSRNTDERQLPSGSSDERQSSSKTKDRRQSPPRRKDQRRSPQRRSDTKQSASRSSDESLSPQRKKLGSTEMAMRLIETPAVQSLSKKTDLELVKVLVPTLLAEIDKIQSSSSSSSSSSSRSKGVKPSSSSTQSSSSLSSPARKEEPSKVKPSPQESEASSSTKIKKAIFKEQKMASQNKSAKTSVSSPKTTTTGNVSLPPPNTDSLKGQTKATKGKITNQKSAVKGSVKGPTTKIEANVVVSDVDISAKRINKMGEKRNSPVKRAEGKAGEMQETSSGSKSTIPENQSDVDISKPKESENEVQKAVPKDIAKVVVNANVLDVKTKVSEAKVQEAVRKDTSKVLVNASMTVVEPKVSETKVQEALPKNTDKVVEPKHQAELGKSGDAKGTEPMEIGKVGVEVAEHMDDGSCAEGLQEKLTTAEAIPENLADKSSESESSDSTVETQPTDTSVKALPHIQQSILLEPESTAPGPEIKTETSYIQQKAAGRPTDANPDATDVAENANMKVVVPKESESNIQEAVLKVTAKVVEKANVTVVESKDSETEAQEAELEDISKVFEPKYQAVLCKANNTENSDQREIGGMGFEMAERMDVAVCAVGKPKMSSGSKSTTPEKQPEVDDSKPNESETKVQKSVPKDATTVAEKASVTLAEPKEFETKVQGAVPKDTVKGVEKTNMTVVEPKVSETKVQEAVPKETVKVVEPQHKVELDKAFHPGDNEPMETGEMGVEVAQCTDVGSYAEGQGEKPTTLEAIPENSADESSESQQPDCTVETQPTETSVEALPQVQQSTLSEPESTAPGPETKTWASYSQQQAAGISTEAILKAKLPDQRVETRTMQVPVTAVMTKPDAASVKDASERNKVICLTKGEMLEKYLHPSQIECLKIKTCLSSQFKSHNTPLLLITNLPEYYEGCYTEDDLAALFMPFGFQYEDENIYVFPQLCMAFVIMPRMKNVLSTLKASVQTGIVFKESTLGVNVVANLSEMSPLGFYTWLMKHVKYNRRDETGAQTVCIKNISWSETKQLKEILNKIQSVINYLPLLNKVFVQFQSIVDADRLGVWYSLLKQAPCHIVYRLAAPRSNTSCLFLPKLPANAVPDSKDAVTGATVLPTDILVPSCSYGPFWVTLRVRPFVFPTRCPWFIIPDYLTIQDENDIEKAYFGGPKLPTIMLTGLPKGEYRHEEVVRLVWRYFPKQNIYSLYYNVVVLPLQRRAFVFFPDWAACGSFIEDHIQRPVTVKGCLLSVHCVLKPMHPEFSEALMYKTLMKLSNAGVPEQILLEDRLLCVEISEASLDVIRVVVDAVMSIDTFVGFLPLANRICIEMADSSGVTKVVEKYKTFSPDSFQKGTTWRKVKRFESSKSLKRRLQLCSKTTINFGPNYISYTTNTPAVKSQTQPPPLSELSQNGSKPALQSSVPGESTVSEPVTAGPSAAAARDVAAKEDGEKRGTEIAVDSTVGPEATEDVEKAQVKEGPPTSLTSAADVTSEVSSGNSAPAASSSTRSATAIPPGGRFPKPPRMDADQVIVAAVRNYRLQSEENKQPCNTSSGSVMAEDTSKQTGQDHYSTDENVSSDLNKDDSVVFEEQCDKAGDTSPEPHSSSSSEQSSRARGGRLSSIVSSSGRQTSTRSPRDSKNSPKSSKSLSSPCSEPNKCPAKPSSSVSVDHQTDQQMHDQDNSCEAQRTGPEEGHTLNKESFQVLDSVDHKDRASPDESSEMNSSLQVLDGVTKDQAATGQPYSHLVQDDGFTVKQLSEEDATSTGAKSDSEGKGQETYSVDTHSEQEPTDKGEEDTRPKDEDKSQVIDSLEDQQTTTKTESEPGMKRKGNTRRQVDSVEGELVQDAAIAESFGRRRSARGKNKDDTANDKPTVTTRSTGGKREITAKKDTSNERTKREDMPALRQTPARKQNMEKASKKEEKTPSKGNTLSKRSDSVVKEEGATNKLLDSAEEAAVKDDQPASRRKGQRGRPKKEVKTSESASVKKGDNNATEKVADKDDHVLDSVEDEMVDDQHLTAQKMQRNRSSSRGGGSGGETEKTSRCTKRKHNDDTVLEESMTVDEVEDEKEGVKTRTRGRPNKRTKQTPVRKSTRLKQATVKENEPVGTEALPPSSVNVCSSAHKHLSTLSSDGQPEIQKTEVESASQADVDVASAGQEPNPEIPESQKLEGCLEQGEEEREGWIRADMKVASKWRRELLRREAKRSRCQSPCDAAAVKPSDLLGQEFVVFKSGYFCNLCCVFWPNESTAKNLHCSSQRHHDNLQKYYQKLQQEFVCKKLHTKSSRFNS